MEEIKRLIIEIDGEEYEMTAGGGQPGHNSVGTEEIKDDSIEMEDLNADVKNKIQKTYDEDDETLYMDYDEQDVNNSNNNGDAGFDAGADNGENDI